MALTIFPTSLDTDTELYDVTAYVTTNRAVHHNALKDAVKAIEAKLGIDNSGVLTSIDYLLRNIPTQTTTSGISNLNADLLDGQHGSFYFPASGASSYATISLNNLASVAINTSLISDSDNTDDLGSLAQAWNNTYSNKVYTTKIVPHADGASAFQITKADGTTSILDIQSVSGYVGIGNITPSGLLHVEAAAGASGEIGKAIILRAQAGGAWPLGGAGGEVIIKAGDGASSIVSGLPGGSVTITAGNHASGDNADETGGTISLNAGLGALALAGQKAGGPICFSTGDATLTERMRILSNGNVGIGTSAPLSVLAVGAGSLTNAAIPVQISTGAAGTELYYSANKNGGYGLLIGYDNGNSVTGGVIRQVSTDPLYFKVNNTDVAMTLLSTSRIGIGTTSPSTKLSILTAGTDALTVGRLTTIQSAMVSFNYNSDTEQVLAFANAAAGGKAWSIGDGIGASAGNFGIYNQTDGATIMQLASKIGAVTGDFGLGIGVAPVAGARLYVGRTYNGTDSVPYMNLSQLKITTASNVDKTFITTNNILWLNQAGNLGTAGGQTLTPMRNQIVMDGAGNLSEVSAMLTDASVNGYTGTATTLKGSDVALGGGNTIKIGSYLADVARTYSNPNITNAYGKYIYDFGTNVTNFTGLYIAAQSASGTKYGINQIDTGLNYFGGRVGIGVTPTVILDVLATGSDSEVHFTGYANQSQLIGYRANGSVASPSTVLIDEQLFQAKARGYDGSAFSGTRIGINFSTAQTWAAGNHGTYMTFWTTPSGSTTIAERMRISDTGNVGIGVTPVEALDVGGNIKTTKSLKFTAAPASDHNVSGTIAEFSANETQNFGDCCYINSDGQMQLGDADAISTGKIVAMCADSSISADATGNYLLFGMARDDTWAWTVGSGIYLTVTGTTGNTLSQTAPSGEDDVVIVVGLATHADRMLFRPGYSWVEYKA